VINGFSRLRIADLITKAQLTGGCVSRKDAKAPSFYFNYYFLGDLCGFA